MNLRFNVRRQASATDSRRAVVFVQELVPKRAVAWLARLAYNEPCRRVPMAHSLEGDRGSPDAVEYRWRLGAHEFSLGGRLAAAPQPLERPSEAEFITEHYWGYTRQPDGGTLEYRVAHPSWMVTDLVAPRLTGSLAPLYGPAWAEVLGGAPRSAYYADGSAVDVYAGRRLITGSPAI